MSPLCKFAPAAVPSVEADADRKTVCFNIGNITTKEANFLAGVIGIFCDPQFKEQCAALKSGKASLRWTNHQGSPRLAMDFLDN